MNESLYVIKSTAKYHSYNNKNLIHIGYGIDNNYVRCAAASIASICINNPQRYFSFYIITNGISDTNKEKLRQLALQYSINITIFHIDCDCLKKLPTKIYLPIPTYFRFILPLILQNEHIDKLFYIDADIICLKTADYAFDLNLGDNLLAAVPDLEWLGRKRTSALGLKNHTYFNAGFLSINMSKWLQMDMLNLVINSIIENPQKFQYLDQDALNLISTGKVSYLDRAFNCIEPTKEEESSVVFLHFAANPKPWSLAWPICGKTNDFNINLYQSYEEKTPWRSMPPQKPANYKEMEFYSKCLRKHSRYRESFYWYLKYLIAKANYLLK